MFEIRVAPFLLGWCRGAVSGSTNHLPGFLKRCEQFIFALGLVPALPFSGAFYSEVLNVLQTLTSLNPPLGRQGLTSNVVLMGADFVDGLTAVCFGHGITVNPVTIFYPTLPRNTAVRSADLRVEKVLEQTRLAQASYLQSSQDLQAEAGSHH